jgi:Domain of unknown function (DUF4438)
VSRPRDNRAALVTVAAEGIVAPARWYGDLAGTAGDPPLLPGCGGVAVGVHMGDDVDNWLGDHLMPGACIEDRIDGQPGPGSVHMLACLGNRVRFGSGEYLGVIAGKRGGLAPGFLPPSLLAVEAPDELLERLCPGERVIVETTGRGLQLPDHPFVGLFNLSPALLDLLPVTVRARQLEVTVRAWLPPWAASSGIGQDAWIGDVDIGDEEALVGRPLRYGDLVGFRDLDSSAGRFRRPGYVSVGLVCHGPGRQEGHGPGVCILLSGPAAALTCVEGAAASLGTLLAELAADRNARDDSHAPGRTGHV